MKTSNRIKKKHSILRLCLKTWDNAVVFTDWFASVVGVKKSLAGGTAAVRGEGLFFFSFFSPLFGLKDGVLAEDLGETRWKC